MADAVSGTNGKITYYDERIRLLGFSTDFDTTAMLEAEIKIMELKNTPFTNQISYFKEEETAWGALKTGLKSFEDIVFGLRVANASGKVISGDTTGYANITATSSAIDNNYTLEIENIASTHKIMSDKVLTAAKDPLGYEQTLYINGKALEIKVNMSMNDLVGAINGGSYQAKAVVINGHLMLTSAKEGEEGELKLTEDVGNKVKVSDASKISINVSGNISNLAESYELSVGKLATKQVVSSQSQTGTNLSLGYTGSFELGGASIEVVETDSLESIVDKINKQKDSTVTASLDSSKKLILSSKVTGEKEGFSIDDKTANKETGKSLFESIGMLDDNKSFKKVESEAGNAKYTIDGVPKESSKNEVTDIDGLSLTLKAETTDPITLSVGKGNAKLFEEIGLVLADGTVKNEYEKASDAHYSINGIKMTSATNDIGDAVPGLTIQLQKATTSPIKVTISENKEEIKDKIKTFVTQYNEMIKTINDLTGKDKFLQGESIPRKLQNDMASSLLLKTESLLMTFDIGIKLNADTNDGQIVLDTTKLDKALSENYEEVTKLFSGQNGIAKQLYDKLRIASNEQGTIATTLSGIDESIGRLNDTIEKNKTQFSKQQDTLLHKYATFEVLMNSLTSEQTYMTSLFESMNAKN